MPPRLPRLPRLLAAGALLLAACNGDDRQRARLADLIALFPVTDAARERGAIDLGTPGGDALLLSGWQPGARLDDGTSVAWAIERKASVRFSLREPAPRRVRLRARQAGDDLSLGDRRAGTPLLLALNGQRVGHARIGESPEEIEIALPAAAQRAGDNVFELQHPTIQAAHVADEQARPRNAVAYDRIDIERTEVGPATSAPALIGADTAAPALVLPPGSEVRWFVRAPRDAELHLVLQRDEAAHDAVLHVLQMGADGALRESVLLDAAATSFASRTELDAGEDDLLGVVLRSTGAGAVRLTDAAVVGTARTPPDVPAPREPSPPAPAPRDATTRPPDVLLYVIDTLRADHLGCYGYGRPTSPRIDVLAHDGVTFTHATAQAPWTRPSVGSILTGLEPLVHGASSLRRQLRPDIPTLAETLRTQGGYETVAFVTNANVSGRLGFARGFETWVELPEDHARPELHVPSRELVAAVQAWLARRSDTRPLFLYVHASDPHAPYTPEPALLARFASSGAPAPDVRTLRGERRPDGSPEPDASVFPASRLAALTDAYDAEIAQSDAGFGAVVDALDARAGAAATIVVLTSDHGEELGDHGDLEHGHSLHDELLHVPLIVRLPDGSHAGERRDEVVQHVDVLPTALDLLGLVAPPDLPGRALLASDSATSEPRQVRSHTDFGPLELMSLTDRRWKAVQVIDGPRARHGVALYDRATDPGEHDDVARRDPLRVGWAAQQLEVARRHATTGARRAPLVDDETAARLRALGYSD